jgi:hypothetical protein
VLSILLSAIFFAIVALFLIFFGSNAFSPGLSAMLPGTAALAWIVLLPTLLAAMRNLAVF